MVSDVRGVGASLFISISNSITQTNETSNPEKWFSSVKSISCDVLLFWFLVIFMSIHRRPAMDGVSFSMGLLLVETMARWRPASADPSPRRHCIVGPDCLDQLPLICRASSHRPSHPPSRVWTHRSMQRSSSVSGSNWWTATNRCGGVTNRLSYPQVNRQGSPCLVSSA